jgi:hypothetical protein
VRWPFILLEPVLPRRHQGLSGSAVVVQQMKHAPWSPATRAPLGVAADGSLVVEEMDGLLQHRFGEPQLGMGIAEVMHQRRGVAVMHE